MSEMIEYTLEIYKSDKRTKEGRRLYAKQDFTACTKDHISAIADEKRELGFIVEVFETYTTSKNLQSGVDFRERYDTPYFCSPRSESYWTM